jgi:hypothetical protein
VVATETAEAREFDRSRDDEGVAVVVTASGEKYESTRGLSSRGGLVAPSSSNMTALAAGDRLDPPLELRWSLVGALVPLEEFD